jgi:hypothetical protein
MKINCSLCLFFLVHYVSFCQSISIKGRVQNEIGQAIPSASITISPKSSNTIIAFSIADNNGVYHLSCQGSSDSFRITAMMLGYLKKETLIPAITATINFILEPTVIVLKEVKLKTPPVWQRKDTINYKTSEFKQPQDRVIGDIIARLPGMEVSPGGQIKYNGRPINKYYIEGLDLLEDKYGIANNNIPADAVDKVQVLENHQPIRVLDSISYTDRAALNIKLKNSAKMRLLGRARLGVGASPLLTDDELTAMLFKKKLQFINTYKYNNAGTDYTRELSSQNIFEYINAIQNGAVKSDLFSLAQPPPPSISSKRYLFNNAHVLSVNQLVPLNATYQLRINASYVNDFQKQQSFAATKFYLPTDTIYIRETNKWQTTLNLLQTEISLIANKPKFYLKNLLKFQGNWATEKSSLITSSEINQQLNNPFFNVSNDFKLIKTKTKYIYELASYVGYSLLPQSLSVMPGLYTAIINTSLPYDALIQQASLKTSYTDNHISLRKRKSKLLSQFKIGFNIQSQSLVTDLLTDISGTKQSVADTFQNKLGWKRLRIYSENSWSYENNKWQLSLNLPLSYNKIDYKDTLLKTKSGREGFFVNPSTSVILQLNSKWNLTTSASYARGFGDIAAIAGGYILKTYRNLSNNNAPLAETKSANVSATLTFRNPLKIVFLNSSIMFTKNKSNLLYSQRFNGNLETLIALLQNNYANRTTVSGRFSKYFIDWKTSIGINYSYSFGTQQQLQQDKLVTFANKNYTIGTTVGIKLSPKITTDYSGTYFTYLSKSQLQQSSSAIQSANQTFSVNYYPTAQLIFRLSGEHYYVNNNPSSSRNYYFADMNMRYKPNKSKIDYELICQNLFNTKNFITAFLLNNVEMISEYQIRPSQVLFKISFSF